MATERSGAMRERAVAAPAAPPFSVRVRGLGPRDSWEAVNRFDSYAAARAFVAGDVAIEGDVVEAVRWWRTHHDERPGPLTTLAARLHLESFFQTPAQAARDIEFHYDRSNAFYAEFLDRRMVYSAAYFTDPAQPLDEAQLAKLDLILRKLALAPGERFLDVGCGWGALLVRAAMQYGAQAFGCTLSRRQLAYVEDLVKRAGLTGRVTAAHRDWRSVDGRFDKIASIGMYEHVGRHRLRAYFSRLAALLAPNGLLLNSGIARPETSGDDRQTLFVRRFVFPGGELPHFSEVVRAAELAGFSIIDVENLRQHYALTCRIWATRLQEHQASCLRLVDARTFRTWLLYLAGASVAFDRGELELYHLLLARRGQPTRLTRTRV